MLIELLLFSFILNVDFNAFHLLLMISVAFSPISFDFQLCLLLFWRGGGETRHATAHHATADTAHWNPQPQKSLLLTPSHSFASQRIAPNRIRFPGCTPQPPISIYVSIHLSIYPFIHLSIYLSTFISIYIYLSVLEQTSLNI